MADLVPGSRSGQKHGCSRPLFRLDRAKLAKVDWLVRYFTRLTGVIYYLILLGFRQYSVYLSLYLLWVSSLFVHFLLSSPFAYILLV
jgi:hypothetical protein